MADTLHAGQLVADDARYSRGLVVDEAQLLSEERELEQEIQDRNRKAKANNKGKGRATANEDEHDNGGYDDMKGHGSHAGRRKSQDADDDDQDEDEDETGHLNDDNGEVDDDSIPLHHRHRRRPPRINGNGKQNRPRSTSMLGGLLEKSTLPDAGVSKQELRNRYIRRIVVNALFIAAWYIFSTLISLYNKWMFSPEHYNFGFPLFVTSCHMLVQFVLCSIVLSVFPSLRPSTRPDPRGYGTKVLPCGLATGLDIGLSNLSLKTITLSFYTMCKSSVLGFVLLFAFVFRLEKPTLPLIGIIAIITSGVIMMVSSETQFHLVGMMQVLTASCLSGLRWSLTQILLDKESMGMNNPFATLFWLAPIMGISLALCSIFIEGWFTIFSSVFFDGFQRILVTMGVILLPGVIAFSMNVAEFGLIQRTSVVTLSVAGIFKEVATIFLSTVVFHDQLTPINISGLCVALVGIALYNYMKFRNYRSAEKKALKGGAVAMAEAGGENGHGHGRDLSEEDDANRDPESQQFQLVGEEDFLSSEEEEEEDDMMDDKQRARIGLSSLAEQRGKDSVVHLPTYAQSHPNSRKEAEEMERDVKQDPLLVDIEREEHDLEAEMDRTAGKGKGDKSKAD